MIPETINILARELERLKVLKTYLGRPRPISGPARNTGDGVGLIGTEIQATENIGLRI